MITTFTFVRHGETDWNKKGIVQGASNIPLNAKGVNQAHEKAAFFNEKKYDIAYSSPLIRAKKTMQIILEQNQLPLTIMTDARLKERCFGEAEGIHFMYNQSFRDRKILPNGYETDTVIETRLYEFLLEKTKQHQGANLLVTAHSHVLKAAHRAIHEPKLDYKAPLANLGVLIIEYHHADKTWHIPYYEGEMSTI